MEKPSNYIYCPNCGKLILKSVTVCPYCKHPISQSTVMPKPQAAKVNPYQPAFKVTSAQHLNEANNENYVTAPRTQVLVNRINTKPCSPGKAIKSFWTNYINFYGKTNRSAFWKIWGLEYIIGILFWILMLSALLVNCGVSLSILFALYLIWKLTITVPNISLRTRRFRDAGLPLGVAIALLVINYAWFVPPIYIVALPARVASFVIECLPSVKKSIQIRK